MITIYTIFTKPL